MKLRHGMRAALVLYAVGLGLMATAAAAGEQALFYAGSLAAVLGAIAHLADALGRE